MQSSDSNETVGKVVFRVSVKEGQVFRGAVPNLLPDQIVALIGAVNGVEVSGLHHDVGPKRQSLDLPRAPLLHQMVSELLYGYLDYFYTVV